MVRYSSLDACGAKNKKKNKNKNKNKNKQNKTKTNKNKTKTKQKPRAWSSWGEGGDSGFELCDKKKGGGDNNER